jgi:hypothetical protein
VELWAVDAGGSPAASHFLLFAQKKVTKEKGTRMRRPCGVPEISLGNRAAAELAGGKKSRVIRTIGRPLRTVLADFPRFPKEISAPHDGSRRQQTLRLRLKLSFPRKRESIFVAVFEKFDWHAMPLLRPMRNRNES